MHTSISNVMEERKIFFVFLYTFLALVAVMLPLSYVHATSIGTNVTVSGNTTLGDDATSDTLTVTARLAADLDPNANNTINLGAYSLAYANIFASGTMYTAGLTVDGNTTIGNLATADTLTVTARLASNLNPSANNTYDLGAYGNAWNDLFVSGTTYISQLAISTSVTSTGNINPGTQNNYDLGILGTNAWNDIFASGTIYADQLSLITSASSTGAVTAPNFIANNNPAPQYSFNGYGKSGFGIVSGSPVITNNGTVTTTFDASSFTYLQSNGNRVDILTSGQFLSNSSPTISGLGAGLSVILKGTQLAASTGDDVVLQGNATRTAGNLVNIKNNATSKLVVDWQGYLGIATTTPRSLLQVSGESGATTSTIWVGDLSGVKGQICMGDSDGAGAHCFFDANGTWTSMATTTY